MSLWWFLSLAHKLFDELLMRQYEGLRFDF
jgi:hypothetical protein